MSEVRVVRALTLVNVNSCQLGIPYRTSDSIAFIFTTENYYYLKPFQSLK